MVERAGVDMGGMGGIICLKFYFSWTKLVVVDTYASSSEKMPPKFFLKQNIKIIVTIWRKRFFNLKDPKKGLDIRNNITITNEIFDMRRRGRKCAAAENFFREIIFTKNGDKQAAVM